jgi:hypothetical protein
MVLLSAMVGLFEVLQQTPSVMTESPKLLVIKPPPIAVVCVIDVNADVVSTGSESVPVEGSQPIKIRKEENADSKIQKRLFLFMACNFNFLKVTL